MRDPENVVSVVIPMFNADNTVANAIDSVFASCDVGVHVIVVDDGSTDNSARVVKSHPHSERIRYVYQANEGVSAARNSGIALVDTPFIGFLDADDAYCDDMLAKCVSTLSASDADLVSVDNYEVTISNGVIASEVVRQNGWVVESSKKSFCEVMRRGGIGGPQKAVFRRHVFDIVGAFDVDLPVYEDLDLWTRIALKRLKWVHISEPLVRRYVRGANTSLYSADPGRNVDCRRMVMRKYFAQAVEQCDAFREVYHDVLWDFGVRYISEHRRIGTGIMCLMEAMWQGRSTRRLMQAVKRRASIAN
jgi:glycosyltransferase involved in cell wall biosynthesis